MTHLFPSDSVLVKDATDFPINGVVTSVLVTNGYTMYQVRTQEGSGFYDEDNVMSQDEMNEAFDSMASQSFDMDEYYAQVERQLVADGEL
jgi:hypothetical protein